jgi:hypothetical protein
MVATEGFSRVVRLPGAIELLTKYQLLFFPLREQLIEQVPLPTGSMYHTIFLPEVCGLPLGMAWPTTICFAKLQPSILGGPLKSGYSHFLHIVTALIQPKLTSSLHAVQQDPNCFMSPSIPFLEVHDTGFPDIDTDRAGALLLIVELSRPSTKWPTLAPDL